MRNEKEQIEYTDADAETAKKNGLVGEHVPNSEVGQILSDRLRTNLDKLKGVAKKARSFTVV